MKEFSKWKESEVKKLFDCMAKTRQTNKSLLMGFVNLLKNQKEKRTVLEIIII